METTQHRRRTRRQELGARLWRLADLEQANSPRRSFSSRAYRRAVWSLDDIAPDLSAEPGELRAVAGIGTAIAAMIVEFRETGRVRRLDELERLLPTDAATLSRLPRMTPRRLRWLKAELRVESTEDALAAVVDGSVSALPGVGPATLSVWRQRLVDLPSAMPIAAAAPFAERFRGHVARHVPDCRIEVVGSLRRLEEWVGVIELLAADREDVNVFLAGSSLVRDLTVQPDNTLALDTLAGAVAVHRQNRRGWGAALVATTGPSEHVAALSTHAAARGGDGAWSQAASETAVYRRLGSNFIPPPARSAVFGMRVQLVAEEDLRGDFHMHSDWSPDGRQSLSDLIGQAVENGWKYVAVTDHAYGLRLGGLDVSGLSRQREAIQQLREQHPGIVILHGAELNIGRGGELDFDDEALLALDFRLAAVHSAFDLPVVEQTERVLRAVRHPLVHAIAHPTGRRIGIRAPLRLDLRAVFDAAAEHRTALEVNGHLDRLDLSAENVAGAPADALFVANSDAHRRGEHRNLRHAVGVLQKAGVEPRRVVNTWDVGRLQRWLATKEGFEG